MNMQLPDYQKMLGKAGTNLMNNLFDFQTDEAEVFEDRYISQINLKQSDSVMFSKQSTNTETNNITIQKVPQSG